METDSVNGTISRTTIAIDTMNRNMAFAYPVVSEFRQVQYYHPNPIKPAVATPLYLGPFVSTYNQIIETQRQAPRSLVNVPDIPGFLQTNFFIEGGERNTDAKPPVVKPPTQVNVQTPMFSHSPKKVETIQNPQAPVLSATEKDLALDLVAMSTTSSPSVPKIRKEPEKVKQSTGNEPPNRKKVKSQMLNRTPEWMEKRLQQDRAALAEIKKRKVVDKFGVIGAVPALNLTDEKNPFLQCFVRHILRERNPKIFAGVVKKTEIDLSSDEGTKEETAS